MQSAVLPQQTVCLSVCPSFHLSVTLRYRDHIGWKSPKIISLLVSLWCSLSADANITDLFQREHPKILTKVKWPTPCRIELSVADIQWQISAEWLEIAQWSQWELIGNHHRSFHCYDRWHPTASPSLKWGPKCTLVILCRIPNGHISATGDLIYFMFGSM